MYFNYSMDTSFSIITFELAYLGSQRLMRIVHKASFVKKRLALLNLIAMFIGVYAYSRTYCFISDFMYAIQLSLVCNSRWNMQNGFNVDSSEAITFYC